MYLRYSLIVHKRSVVEEHRLLAMVKAQVMFIKVYLASFFADIKEFLIKGECTLGDNTFERSFSWR